MGGTFVFYPFDPYKELQSDHELDQKSVPEYSRSNGILLSGSEISPTGNDFVVTPATGLQVNVASGSAYVQGRVYSESQAQTLSITENLSGSTRTDLVVLRLTLGAGIFARQVLTGTTTPVRTTTSWDMPLAEITVHTGDSSIPVSQIKDVRSISLPSAQVISACVNRQNALAIPSSSLTALSFDNAKWDTHNIWDGSTKLTAPKDGFYLLYSLVAWAGNSLAGRREHRIRLNSTDNVTQLFLDAAATSDPNIVPIMTVVKLSKGDYIQNTVNQASGATLSLLISTFYPVMSMTYLGD